MFNSKKIKWASVIAIFILSLITLSGLYIYDIIDGVFDFQKQTYNCAGTTISAYPTIKTSSTLVFQGSDRRDSKSIGVNRSEDKTFIFSSNRDEGGATDDNYKANTAPDINLVKKIRNCFPDDKLQFYQYKNEEEIAGEMRVCIYKNDLYLTEPFECKDDR